MLRSLLPVLLVLTTIAYAQQAPLLPGTLMLRVTPAEDPVHVNRAIFSLVNLQRSFAESSPESWSRIEALNLRGTQVRTEVMIDLLEPANDNSDPYDFAWDRLQTNDMARFLPGRSDEFYEVVGSLGAVPVTLLTYNAGWLAREGRANDPPSSQEEWAEFASAAVEHLLSLHESGLGPFPRYIEVWNEPAPGGPYWSGTVQEYAELFRTVADRIHRDYPGVKVGGPSFLADQGVHLMRFIELAGDVVDFVTLHVYNDDPVLLPRRLERWADYVEDATGRELPLMLTETDNWQLTGERKFDYLMIRQFELLAADPRIIGVHHFSLPFYREAPSRVFGLVRPDGSVVDDNYWPYWYFAPLHGEQLQVEVSEARGGGVHRPLSEDRALRDPRRIYAVGSIVAESGTAPSASVLFYAPREGGPVSIALALPATFADSVAALTAVTPLGPEPAEISISRRDRLGDWVVLVLDLFADAGVGYQLLLRPE